MKYLLQIYPDSAIAEFERLSEHEQEAIVGEYRPSARFSRRHRRGAAPAVRDRDHGARPERQDASHRRSVRGREGAPRRLLPRRGRRSRRGARDRRADPGRADGRCDRGAAAGGEVALLEQVFRDEWGRVLASLVGFLGDFDLAEDAAQEAFAIAAQRWPRDGTPPNPGAWLTITARNRAIDRLRRDRTLAEKTRLLDVPEAVEDEMGEDLPRRAAGADLHLLPSVARARGPGRPDLARARRSDHGGNRARLPGPRGDDETAAFAGKTQDQRCRHPLPRPGRAPAAGAAGCGAGGRLPDLQRGLQRPRRPRGGGAAAGRGAHRR